ncbi:MAG: carboxypeptidase regulatory-like domain-containing protein [Candidatus Aminicenantes bacterium]|nr:carboxypeptidase regulatory-like domain-containing protein [Candidatus Aminicenantes bacterium]
MKKKKSKINSFVVCVFVFLWVFFGCTAAAQAQLVSVGILVFQDETGKDVPAALVQKLARDIQQKLALSYKDLLPRLVDTEIDAADYKNKTVEELAAIGRQKGLKFLVRGGILALTSEKTGRKIEVNVELYAEVISVESLSVSGARASGASTTKGKTPSLHLETIDFSGPDFPRSGLGLALSMAADQLAAAIHGAVSAPVETPVEETAAVSEEETAYEDTGVYEDEAAYEDTSAYSESENDEELQQLISQAEELVYNSTAGTESLESLSQTLQSLQEALNTKVTLLEQGGDTSQIDREIAQHKQELENLIQTVTDEISSSEAYDETGDEYTGDEYTEEESSKKKNLLSSLGRVLDQSLNILQKIKEIRSTLRGADEESQYDETGAGYEETGTEYEETGSEYEESGSEYEESGYEEYEEAQEEETTEDISGFVTEDGEPAAGVTVTDPESGVSTTTDSSGSYVLQGIPSGRLSRLVLLKNGKKVADGKIDLLKGRTAIADWELKPRTAQKGKKGAALRILPSCVSVASGKKAGGGTGTLKGVVRDAKGKPMPRVLVKLEGAAAARSDSKGRYTFVNVPAGAHRLVVFKGGKKVKSQRVTIVAKKSVLNKIQFTPRDSVLRKTKKTGVIFGGSDTILQGVVTDAKNRPLAGVKVTAFQAGGAVSVKTGPGGTYKLRNIKPGKYRLLIAKTGFTGINRKISVKAKKKGKYNFKLKPSTSSPYIQRLLVKQRSLTGRIIDTGKKPIAYATVYIKGQNRVRTNRYGYYTVRNLKPGRYSVRVSKKGYRGQKQKIKVSSLQSARRDFVLSPLRSGKRVTGVTKPSRKTLPSRTRTAYLLKGQLKGFVTGSRTRKPIAGAYVTISGQRSIVTNRSGYYVSGKLKPGSYKVSVKKSGYLSSSRSVKVQAGKAVTVNFRLSPLLIKYRKK